MKIIIDLEKDSKIMLNYACIKIGDYLIKKLKEEGSGYNNYISFFENGEVTYSELIVHIKDELKLNTLISYLKDSGYIFEKAKGVYMRI
jgi:uncharacterized protein YebE (UPF0316 family)